MYNGTNGWKMEPDEAIVEGRLNGLKSNFK